MCLLKKKVEKLFKIQNGRQKMVKNDEKKAIATRPFDVEPSNFHTMTPLGSHGAFWKKILKNFSKFKMAAIFRSKMTENGVLRFCFHPLQTNVSWNFLITAEINEKWIKLNKRKCILCNSCFVLDNFFHIFFFGYCFVLCLI